MKIIILISGYTLRKTFEVGFKTLGNNITSFNYGDYYSNYLQKFDSYSRYLPFRYRSAWRRWYLKNINKRYLELFFEEKPDLVFTYNDQMLLAETIKEYRKFNKKCRFCFYLGDSPLFLQQREFFIETLAAADHIFAPDTYWLQQLNMLGFKYTSFLIPGYNSETNYLKKPTEEDLIKYSHDIFYIGRSYLGQYGYKRALFISKFTKFDSLIMGSGGWKKWFNDFPELKDCIQVYNGFVSYETINTIMNCCKLYPIDANPGIINGIHLRVLDCIGSGILPVIEYRKDIEIVFRDTNIPVFQSYDQIQGILNYYLENEQQRIELIDILREYLLINYTPEIACRKILEKI